MRIPLDTDSEIPLYRQVESFLRLQIQSGSMPAGTRLPATRQLAEELGISRITVKNAYAELESDGWIGGREGSGTFVMDGGRLTTAGGEPSGIPWPLWQMELPPADAKEADGPAAERVHPHPISFTGVGDPRYFPLQDFYKALRKVIRRDGIEALEYGEFKGGYQPLRETIAQVLTSQGIQTRPGNVLITTGSQQALALACRVLLNPGDTVLVEKPTYNFALELFRSMGSEIVGIPVDENGMITEVLEGFLQKFHPRLVYTIPNFQNPTGCCLSSPRRRQLLAVADRYNIPLLEDDFAGDLRFEGRALPAIKALDPGGRVIYTGTFSKMLMPGLRMGFLVADGPVYASLVRCKRVHDLTSSTLVQRTLNEYVTVGRYQRHVRRSCRIYRKRRDAMLAAIREFLPEGIAVNPPQGGLFIWLRLPDGISSQDLLLSASVEGVEFAPGTRFFPDPADGKPYLRLNFATRTEEEILIGIRRLGTALRHVKQV